MVLSPQSPTLPAKLPLQEPPKDDPGKTLEDAIRNAAKLSRREFEPKDSLGTTIFAGDSFFFITPQNDLKPLWGLRDGDRYNRIFFYSHHGWLHQSAITNDIKRYSQTPWEISGGRNLVRRFTEVLQEAEFGEGYDSFITKVLTDYYTQDFGAVIEVIGAGDPSKPLKGPVLGLAHLDSLRCVATGNLEFPIIYWSRRTGKMHRMHNTRVLRIVDMPSSEERAYNNGLCALSRMIAIVNAQILLSKHQNESLSDMPPTGLMTLSNAAPGDWEQMMQQYEAGRSRDGQQVYRNFAYIQGSNPAEKVVAEIVRFSMLPEGFNYREYIEIHVNAIALALGTDPQEIWPLTGAPLGTGTQSKVLHAKGQAKGFGHLMRKFERIWNIGVLPKDLEFKHKFEDRVSDQEEADTAQKWIDAANSAQLSTEQRLQLIANKVPAFADVLLDEAGNIRLPDVDPKADETQTIGEDQNTLTTLPMGEQATGEADALMTLERSDERLLRSSRDGNYPQDGRQLPAGENEHRLAGDAQRTLSIERTRDRIRAGEQHHSDTGTLARKELADVTPNHRIEKAIQSTLLDFESDVTDAIEAGQEGDVARRRFGVIMRDLLRRHGTQAYKDGLEDGGVETDALEDDDQSVFNSWLTTQSGYVTDFANTLFSGESEIDAESRATLWGRKSLMSAFELGRESADRNGMYEFTGTDGDESCEDCQRLSGQVHRLWEWNDKEFNPRGEVFKGKCGGFRCQHFLEKTTGRARGSW
jgi:hypothetical protein